ncbi:hypothetical protein CL619_00285 [archaeon]|nr:hypothetical protein [archaeon]|tara:strand:- start:1551 stop:1820 length:270 start_codon:yes stop_codon:yes gene_type:complete
MGAPNPDYREDRRSQVGSLVQGRFIDAVESAVFPESAPKCNSFYSPFGRDYEHMINDIYQSGWVEKVDVQASLNGRLDGLASELAGKYF